MWIHITDFDQLMLYRAPGTTALGTSPSRAAWAGTLTPPSPLPAFRAGILCQDNAEPGFSDTISRAGILRHTAAQPTTTSTINSCKTKLLKTIY